MMSKRRVTKVSADKTLTAMRAKMREGIGREQTRRVGGVMTDSVRVM